MIELIPGTVYFPPLRDRGPDTRLATPCVFSGRVKTAAAVITGVNYGFTDDDKHLFRTIITLNADLDNDIVSVSATFGLRDNSGYWDDRYDGVISFVVIADVADRAIDFVSSAEIYANRTLLQSEQYKALGK